jgi:hypothetical protein
MMSGELHADALAGLRWSLHDGATMKTVGIELERLVATNPASSIWKGAYP